MEWVILPAAVFLASLAGTRGLATLLQRKNVLDIPEERSNHTIPVPRGGGLVVMGCFLIGTGGWLASSQDVVVWLMLGAAGFLALISWIDDCKKLPIWPRLLAQVIAIMLVLAVWDRQAIFFGGIFPWWIDRLAAGLLWLWFVNLYNFMDGIDGITGAETLLIAMGFVGIGSIISLPEVWMIPAIVLAAVVSGFLVWNWHPASIFLGDVGSIPIGFIAGAFLLTLAASGYGAAALILPLYYLTDSTWTLGMRLLKGKRIWQAHSEHFYQRAVRRGWRHSQVVGVIAGFGLFHMCLAFISVMVPGYSFLMVIAAVISTLILLRILGRGLRHAAI